MTKFTASHDFFSVPSPPAPSNEPTTPPDRVAYLTTNRGRLAAGGKIAADCNCELVLTDPLGPLPAGGECDAVVVDLRHLGLDPIRRKWLLAGLVRLARTVPVGVHDLGTGYAEAAFFRAAGIRWAPTFRPSLLRALLGESLEVVLTPSEVP